MVTPPRFSLFLTPGADDFAWLAELIGKLGRDHDGMPFEPHMTLYSGSYEDAAVVAAAAAGAVQGIAPLTLAIRGIGYSAEYFRSVFMEFSENRLVYEIRDRLVERLGNDSRYRLTPHLSLLYHDMPVEEKAALARSIILDRPGVRFDTVKMVVPNDPAAGWRDIAGWRTLWRTRLEGASPCGQ